MGHWFEVSKANRQARRMADRHYSYWRHHNRPMSNEVGPPGQKIILLTENGDAVWGSHRPHPDANIERADGLSGMFCFIYRNEGYPVSSSVLIREAVGLTAARWGVDTFWTYVATDQIASEIPGYCFRRAGFRRDKSYHSNRLPLGPMIRLYMSPERVLRCLNELEQTRLIWAASSTTNL